MYSVRHYIIAEGKNKFNNDPSAFSAARIYNVSCGSVYPFR